MNPMPGSSNDHFQEGIELFNNGRFFECHEVWELVWNRADGAEKTSIQGLIQAAVAILHLQRGNREGARIGETPGTDLPLARTGCGEV